jgi:cell division protease FtsH
VLEIHARKLKLDEAVDLGEIARMTPGFAGADLANTLNEAALLAARRERDSILMKDVTDAIERTVAGLEKKNRRLSPKERSVVSFHECGHAICAAASPGADPVQKISIIPRGVAALGYTIQMPLEDRYLMTKGELLNRITVLYGGRVAESIVFGDITTGAHDDIRKATDLARRMVVEYGMSKRVGPINYAPEASANPFGMNASQNTYTAASHSTTEAIENEVRQLTDGCYRRAFDILVSNRVLLEEMAEYLLEHEVLDGDSMKAYLDRTLKADPLAEPPTSEVPRSSVS